MSDWSPAHYLAFADERSRPARDLLAQVPLAAARTIFDLGCGPGNSTALLAKAYPEAKITGIDNSPAMLAEARKVLPDHDFIAADLATWSAPTDADLLFANATFQWVPDHLTVLWRLLHNLRPGGVLAVQMPDNLNEPSHRLMASVAAAGPWSSKLSHAAAARDVLPPPEIYYARLKPACSRLDIWHTIYNHPLAGAEGIAGLFRSTGLRPYLQPLTEEEQADYLDRYTQRLAEAYPAQSDGTVLLRFPRLFIVAVR